MRNKIITEKDFWKCSDGLMPSPIQNNGGIAKKESGETYITKKDTSTISTMDFSCKWIMLIAAALAAIIAVAIVATGGAALGALVAAGAMAGAAGAAVGAPLGSLICGQKAAIARTWNTYKSDFKVQGQEAITGKDTMTCALFGSSITFAPEIKNWWQAAAEGGANFISGTLEGMLAGAGIGIMGGGIAAFTSIGSTSMSSSAFAIHTARALGNNAVRNWLSSVGLQTGGRLGVQLASTQAITMAAALRGSMVLEAGLRSYSKNESVELTDIGRGFVGMELGTAQSIKNIATGDWRWQYLAGIALWFVPFHTNTKGRNKTAPEKAKNESSKQVKNVETKTSEKAEGKHEAYEAEASAKLKEGEVFQSTNKEGVNVVKQVAANLTQKGLDHIIVRHWFTSGAKGAGKFAEGTTVTDLRGMIQTTTTHGVFRPNTMGRAGTIAEYNFGRVIGTTSSGASTSNLRVVIGINGNVITAFPF